MPLKSLDNHHLASSDQVHLPDRAKFKPTFLAEEGATLREFVKNVATSTSQGIPSVDLGTSNGDRVAA
jgi:hypothetical protein